MTALQTMPSLPMTPSVFATPQLYRLSVQQYHQMIDAGILVDGDHVELLEGLLVQKMTQKPPHRSSLQSARKRIEALLPIGWTGTIQSPITLGDGEPEPDFCVARGSDADYRTRHPEPADIGLLVEVSDTTLATDQGAKARSYARAGIREYWIINLVDRQVEIYTQPSGATATPGYGQRQVLAPGASVPLELDGMLLGSITVDDLLP